MNKRLSFLMIAAWLFVPPMVFSSSTARAQQPAAPVVAPKIDRFDLDPPNRLVPGEALIFRLTGTPHGDASVKIDGVRGKVALNEVFRGVYEGAYTLIDGDKVMANSVVIATLRLGKQERSTVLAQPLVESPRVAAYQLAPARFTFQ
jgi:hypothetical protein